MIEQQILSEIIASGGLYSQVACLIKDNPTKVEGFILECFQQTHTPGFQERYSQDLIDRIIQYGEQKTGAKNPFS